VALEEDEWMPSSTLSLLPSTVEWCDVATRVDGLAVRDAVCARFCSGAYDGFVESLLTKKKKRTKAKGTMEEKVTEKSGGKSDRTAAPLLRSARALALLGCAELTQSSPDFRMRGEQQKGSGALPRSHCGASAAIGISLRPSSTSSTESGLANVELALPRVALQWNPGIYLFHCIV